MLKYFSLLVMFSRKILGIVDLSQNASHRIVNYFALLNVKIIKPIFVKSTYCFQEKEVIKLNSRPTVKRTNFFFLVFPYKRQLVTHTKYTYIIHVVGDSWNCTLTEHNLLLGRELGLLSFTLIFHSCCVAWILLEAWTFWAKCKEYSQNPLGIDYDQLKKNTNMWLWFSNLQPSHTCPMPDFCLFYCLNIFDTLVND